MGRDRGIFKEWTKCNKSVHKYPGACYQSFGTKEEANKFLLIHRHNSTGEDIDSSESLKPYQKTRPLYSSIAKHTIYSPSTSTTSKNSRRRKTHFNELNLFPPLSNSQQNPTKEDEENFTFTSPEEEFKSKEPEEETKEPMDGRRMKAFMNGISGGYIFGSNIVPIPSADVNTANQAPNSDDTQKVEK